MSIIRYLTLSIFFSTLFLLPRGEMKAISSYPVPPSLMVHGEGINFIRQFLDVLDERGYKTITYRDYLNSIQSEKKLGKIFILSIDDIGPYRVSDLHKEMIDLMVQRGHVGVLGLVAGDLVDPQDWTYLRNLQSLGWEIANHTQSHDYNGLPSLEYEEIIDEISYVNQKISEHLGEKPITLILPGGTYLYDSRINQAIEFLNMKFIIGIGEGTHISLSDSVYYLGRGYIVGNSSIETINLIENIFHIFPPLSRYSNLSN